MALPVVVSPPVWPPASDVDFIRFRFVIDVCEPETKEVLVELFEKHIKVHSFLTLDELTLDRASVVEDAPSLATIVITDDACRPPAMNMSSFSHSQSSLALPAWTTAAHIQVKSVRRRPHI
jgi:hypothetical protein